ncbi:HD domain-containing protein [Rubripirellula tenax]|nr:metal-dependent phosphohydrolase [Rubripirellula tenax]
MSDRVRRVLDTSPIRRLASITQLGMVSLVYPGATHSRFEHTLGVYGNAVGVLARFAGDAGFESMVDDRLADAFVLAALLHDVGHWPFCHPIEDMRIAELGEHETRIGGWIERSELANCIRDDWACDAADVLSLLCPGSVRPSDHTSGHRFLASCLSGPIDVDKLDYLQRDSLHAGVPYGRNFDAGRLIASLCIHPQTGALAVGDKGRTAAEMMVFSRYIMFSEVYWHHTVRAATAMLQRCVFLLQHRLDLESTLGMKEAEWIANLRRSAEGSVAEPLAEGLFGSRRRLYKRAAEFNAVDGDQVHGRLARKPYWWLVALAERLAGSLSSKSGVVVHAVDVLVDAPPVKLEVDINMDVIGRDGTTRTLGDVSPVASALASQQFDNHVKRVRVFLRDDVRDEVLNKISAGELTFLIMEAIDALESELA